MLKNLILKDFVDELSSKSPAPGGGSVASLSASLASSLTVMVYNLTIGKKSYDLLDENIKKDMETGLTTENGNKFEFLDYIDKDADAFLSLMSAFRLPKSSEEEKKLRQEKIAEKTKGALEVPLKLAEKAFDVYDNVLLASKYGNVNAVSDAGVAALMLQAAIEGAILNVKINLASIKDDKYKKDIMEKCDFIILEGIKKKEEILKEVNKKIE
ncbi:MAG: cyclodeaminase/cyclohydrolase family protein [Bacillota bacterium]|nr:cyclodeaminase/cyclohydrolase family protein [Bacillota bacterium]